ncbi:GDYXXLXY domain-containing protein [Porphyrobacter sp. LM 6]|uniref:GDYXXLXY domain-containing protein n=1 Tax=Porphyrobacter sp. LM 6 TaxID=1896196 RepID=UPI0008466CC9|nr:GDYXXLXY domain-containing protein [Porphyrobacter sp. LM 6]AOL93566.1 GDYXXLXY protein [Porphyrobacter sp. LM 6]
MSRFARLAAVLVPLIGLALLWVQSERTYNSGTEWEVPIQGYDPRDYLRGHYIEFSYDWPGIDEFRDVPPQKLCLEGDAPNLAGVTADAARPCAHPVRADLGGVYGWDALTRGRLYIGQDRAQALQKQLRDGDQRGIVTIRQREDGSFTAVSIRFRPLTPAEIAERDAQSEELELPFPPPPIMSEPASGSPRR